MIKVNLLRNRGEATNPTAATDIDYEPTFNTAVEGGGEGGMKDVVIKVIFMLIGAGGLMTYESIHIGELRSRLAGVNKQKQALATEIQQNQPIAEKAKQLQKEINDLEGRIKIIKDLSRIRLREIKAIDYLQNVIPDRLWLTKLEFKEDSLNVEGGALSDDQLNKFMDSMEGKSYFKNVILLKAVEQKNKEGTIKIFQISSSLTGTD